MPKSEYDKILSDPVKRIEEHKHQTSVNNKKFIKKNRKNMKYYCNEQWDEDRKKNVAPRPCLTYNEIRPIINLILGYDYNQKTDIKFIGVEGTDKWFADKYTKIIKYINDFSQMQYISNQAFAECLISSSSYYEPTISFKKDLVSGDIINHIGYFDEMFFDPASRMYDKSDAGWAFKMMLLSKFILIKMFPEKEKYIKELSPQDEDNDLFVSNTGIYNPRTGAYIYDHKGNIANFAKETDSLFLYADYYYKTKEITELYDYENQERFDISQTNIARADMDVLLREPGRFEVNKRKTDIPYISYMLGDKILKDEISPFYPYDDSIPVVPLHCFFMPAARRTDLKFQGMVEPLIDPQNETNLRASQILHIINTLGNRIWMVDQGAFTPEELIRFRQQKNNPGQTFVKDPSKDVKQVGFDTNLTNLFNLWNLSSDYIKKISGVNPALLSSEDTGDTSGKALAIRQNQGLIAIMGPNMNKQWSRRLLAKKNLAIAMKFFSDEKIVKIIGEREISPQEVQVLRDGFKNLAYDIVVNEIPLSPAIRMYYSEQIKEYLKEGILRFDLMEDLIIKGLDLPFADEYEKRLKEFEEFQANQQATEAGMPLNQQQPMNGGNQQLPVAVNQ